MRIARFSRQDAIRYGIVDEKDLVVLAGDPMFAGFDTTGSASRWPMSRLLAPVIPRSKVVAVGRNYRDHAARARQRGPAGADAVPQAQHLRRGPGRRRSALPPVEGRVDFEGELAVVIGRIAKNVSRRARARARVRLHDRQRRDRARPAEVPTASGRGRRASTPSARWARRSRPTSIAKATPSSRRA